MLKTPSELIKAQIANHIKNGVDISNLLKDLDISNLDLSNSIIRTINRCHESMKNVNFSRATIGYEGANNFLIGCNLSGSNFKFCRVIGKLSIKRAIARNCNFADAYMPEIEYQHADFTGSTLCGIVWVMGSLKGHGAKIPKSQIEKWGVIQV